MRGWGAQVGEEAKERRQVPTASFGGSAERGAEASGAIGPKRVSVKTERGS